MEGRGMLGQLVRKSLWKERDLGEDWKDPHSL